MGTPSRKIGRPTSADPLWASIRTEASRHADEEPVLASFFHATILNHESLEAALSFHLANKLNSATVPAMVVREIVDEALRADPAIGRAVRADIRAVRERDPACCNYCEPLLYFKGFHALQSCRVAHWLWLEGRRPLALYLQNRISRAFDVDIHPAARIGSGVMLDHASGIVVGETAVIEDDVSMLHSVTLGGTGNESGDRHPKVRSGVLIAAGAKLLGNIEIGEGAKVGAGSVVLHDVPPHTTVVGVPARVVGRPGSKRPSRDMHHELPDRMSDGERDG
ncbi:MAG TPA: serine O-acetyltransferase [Gammaproteobacteria bacterium]|nr:serine O-acetyltransferase [Gammaproteobacteria bacterium]